MVGAHAQNRAGGVVGLRGRIHLARGIGLAGVGGGAVVHEPGRQYRDAPDASQPAIFERGGGANVLGQDFREQGGGFQHVRVNDEQAVLRIRGGQSSRAHQPQGFDKVVDSQSTGGGTAVGGVGDQAELAHTVQQQVQVGCDRRSTNAVDVGGCAGGGITVNYDMLQHFAAGNLQLQFQLIGEGDQGVFDQLAGVQDTCAHLGDGHLLAGGDSL